MFFLKNALNNEIVSTVCLHWQLWLFTKDIEFSILHCYKILSHWSLLFGYSENFTIIYFSFSFSFSPSHCHSFLQGSFLSLGQLKFIKNIKLSFCLFFIAVFHILAFLLVFQSSLSLMIIIFFLFSQEFVKFFSSNILFVQKFFLFFNYSF